jgi:uncharacterized protein (DUF2249 family)
MSRQATPSGHSRPIEIEQMVAHHEQLGAQLRGRVHALATAVAATKDFGHERADLHGFLAGEVVPHALAEEDSVYSAGASHATLQPLVAGMTMEHETLVALAARIATDTDGVAVASAAAAFLELFEVHVRKENDLLLPGLLADGVDPAQLLAGMHGAFEARRREVGAGHPGANPTDDAGELLAQTGEPVVDTRVHATGSCASLASESVDALEVGGSFVLVADHDPRGIHYMLDAERPGSTRWEPLEDGPDRWQVRIAKVAAGTIPAG